MSEKENSGSEKQKKFSVYLALDGSFQVPSPLPCRCPVFWQIECGSHWTSRIGIVLKNCRKLAQSLLLSSFLTRFSESTNWPDATVHEHVVEKDIRF
jgi:hypothetical protein